MCTSMTDLRRKQKPIVEGKVISGRTHVSLCTCPLWFLFSSKKKKILSNLVQPNSHSSLHGWDDQSVALCLSSQ